MSTSTISYTRLSAYERELIFRGVADGESIRTIARSLSRAPSTISREVAKRGAYHTGRYCQDCAQRDAQKAASARRRGTYRIVRNRRLGAYIHAKLRLHWSPEQIAHTLRREYPKERAMHVSTETIYTYLYVLPRGELKKELLACLRRRHKYRRKRDSRARRADCSRIEDMLSIEERPAEVAGRTVPGHWEGDLIIGKGKRSALGTLVERTTRTTLLVPLSERSAAHVREAFAREVRRLPQELRLSLTYDQGREMAEHRLFTATTQMKVYFAHPRSPWERGTNENTNSLVRDFFPQGTDFTKLSTREIKRIQHLLNTRPRKVLDWRTPQEALDEVLH